jgi:hypothetical protein
MSSMTQILQEPGLWNGMIIIGVLVLLGESAWRSWTLEGRVDDPARLFPRPAPARLAYAFGPALPPGWLRPMTGDGYTTRRNVQIEYLDEPEIQELLQHGLEQITAELNAGQGATEEWSPIAEQVTAGRSLEDWWSERLQAYDAALKRIDSDQRLPDGSVWHPPMAHAWPYHTLTTEENLRQFVDDSQRLHAYRELRIGHTGEFTTRQHMELEALVNA